MTHKNIFFRFIFFHLLNFSDCKLAEIVDNNGNCTQYPGGILDNFGRKYLTQIQTHLLLVSYCFSSHSEIYIYSALNNSNESYTFMCLGRAGRFWQC